MNVCSLGVLLGGCAQDCSLPYSNCYQQYVEAKIASEKAQAEKSRATAQAQCRPATRSVAVAKEWTSASKAGDGSVFTFRGSRIGEPIETLFPCHTRTDITGKANHCHPDSEIPGMKICYDLSDVSPSDMANRVRKIGDIQVSKFEHHYLDDKFVGFEIWIDTLRFAEMSRMLEAKYGKPTGREVGSVQNRLGATFSQITESWATPDGRLVLQSRWGSIDTARLWFENPAAERTKEERRKAVAKDKAKGAL
jgi:hypothetical protein